MSKQIGGFTMAEMEGAQQQDYFKFFGTTVAVILIFFGSVACGFWTGNVHKSCMLGIILCVACIAGTTIYAYREKI
jgi:hypothetical protein